MQYRDDKGQLHLGSVDVPAGVISTFTEALLRYLNLVLEFEDAYFLHEFRGHKGATVHDP